MSGSRTEGDRHPRLPMLYRPSGAAAVGDVQPNPSSKPEALNVRANRESVQRALALLFLAIALSTCVTLALLTPLGQVADERAHVLRVASLLHGQWIGRRAPFRKEDGTTQLRAGIDVDQAVLGVQTREAQSKLTEDEVTQARAQPWAGFLFHYPIPSVAIYMPAFYVPAAIGMGIAKRAGAGPFVAIYIARLVNVACFIASGLAALLLARRCHALLFCTLMVPMTVSLAGSVNQDGLIIAASVLAAALLTRSDTPTGTGPMLPRSFHYWAAALLLACIVTVKPPYAPLLAMLLLPLPPLRQWFGLRKPLLLRAAVAGLMLLPSLLWFWFAFTTVATPFTKPPYEPGPLWTGPRPAMFDETNAVAQLSILLAEPLRFLTLPLNTFIQDRALLVSAVGVLGWLTVFLPKPLYLLWYVALPAALLCDLVAPRTGRSQGSSVELALGVIVAAACILGIYLSQYLSWTIVGHPTVQGPSGRYLLPVLPFVALSLPVFMLRGGERLRAGLAAVPVVAALAGAAVLPPLIVSTMILR